MKADISEPLCTGHGRCKRFAPEIYRLDDDGYNADRGLILDISADLEAPARKGAKACPERAITISED